MAILAAALVLGGCATHRGVLEAPEGFAAYTDREEFTIVSPEPVKVRVRTVENAPEQTLEFWAQALRRHMSETGYSLLAEGTFTATTGDGSWFEWVAPVGEEDWVYLTAVSVPGETIIIVEAAGRYADYNARREDLLSSLESLRLE